MESIIAADAVATPAPALSQVEVQVLSQFCNAFPSELSFDNILENLEALIDDGSLIVKSSFLNLQVDALRVLLRDTAWGFDVALALTMDGIRLPVILDLADAHVCDIESGIEDGTYLKSENPDVMQHRKTVDGAVRWYVDTVAPTLAKARADGMQASPGNTANAGGPSRVLSVVSKGGVLEVYSEQGVLPGVECESIDCMDGEQGDTFTLSHEWSHLLERAFGDKLPSFMTVNPAVDVEQENDVRFRFACEHIGSLIDQAVFLLNPTAPADLGGGPHERGANRIAVLTNAYQLFTGEDGSHNLVDILTDIRHFCDSERLDYGATVQASYLHYSYERHNATTVQSS